MAKKNTNDKTVKAVMAFIAQGGSIREASDKFKLSHSAVNSLVRGVSHTDVTGLNHEKGKCGVDYIRTNKHIFVNSMKKDKDVAKAPTAKAPAKSPSVEKTAKSVETKPAVAVAVTGSLDLSDNIEAMKTQATGIVTKIDERMAELKAHFDAEMADLTQKREHWNGVATSFDA